MRVVVRDPGCAAKRVDPGLWGVTPSAYGLVLLSVSQGGAAGPDSGLRECNRFAVKEMGSQCELAHQRNRFRKRQPAQTYPAFTFPNSTLRSGSSLVEGVGLSRSINRGVPYRHASPPACDPLDRNVDDDEDDDSLWVRVV